MRFRLSVIATSFLMSLALNTPLAMAAPVVPDVVDKSDLNTDGVVDLVDLDIFSNRHLQTAIEDVDWCAFYEAVAQEKRFLKRNTNYFQKHYKLLLGFIYDYFECGGQVNLLEIKNVPRNYARIAADSTGTGNYYISDPVVGSVFIFDPNLGLIGELKNLDKPLGVAIDTQGYLLVGSDGRDNIEVYDPANGDLLATFADGVVKMPTSINIGPNGDIYVTDSRNHLVQVFEASYLPVRTIGAPGSGAGQLKFPLDATIISRQDNSTVIEEIFIADQGNQRIQVFDLLGNFDRTIEPAMVYPKFCFRCPSAVGTFARLQALGSDEYGRLHVLDSFEAAVRIFDPDPESHKLVGSYGGWGTGPGLLRVPMDLRVTGAGQAIVTDSESNEIETFAVPAPLP